ncbi:MAG: SMP-30/gluconolactonase/LRE family protein [Ignavibacteria bacterium]
MKKLFTLYSVLSLLFNESFAQSPVPDDAVLEKIAGGFQFVEGPVWNDTLGLLFSDMNGNKIYRWTEEDSAVIYLSPSANSNGLAYDLSGKLIIAQTGLRRMALRDSSGTIISIADTFNGKKLNSPNDIAVKSDGSIFFTDPDFNIPQGQQRQLSFKGIFRISPEGTLTVLDTTFDKPNGICFSPDESKLYVNESPNGKIYVWDVENDLTITNKQLFYTIPLGGYADGMKVDTAGNLYCTGPTGVWVISPAGVYLDKIAMPQGAANPSNCNWGDNDRNTLYITAGTSVYRIRLAETVGVKDRGALPEQMELYQNYPNPFNPSTNFGFRISNFGLVSLKIYDVLGNEITTVVEGEFTPGEYVFPFSADVLLSSGTYFYQLHSGEFIQTKKLIFMK